MKITSTLSGTPAAAALVLFVSFVISATARADIYKWTDAGGRTFFSNVAPTPSEKAKNVQLLVKENAPSATAPAQGHAATPTEQALLGRIESLERQLRMQSSPAPPYGTYSAPPPPPASAGNYAGDYSYPAYYPNHYYPAPYYYASPIYPVRAFVSRPVFAASRGGSFHRGGGHGGRR